MQNLLPFSIFILFFRQIFQIILNETNCYFCQYMSSRNTGSISVQPPDITIKKMYARAFDCWFPTFIVFCPRNDGLRFHCIKNTATDKWHSVTTHVPWPVHMQPWKSHMLRNEHKICYCVGSKPPFWFTTVCNITGRSVGYVSFGGFTLCSNRFADFLFTDWNFHPYRR